MTNPTTAAKAMIAVCQSFLSPLGPFFIQWLATGHNRHSIKANIAAEPTFIHVSIKLFPQAIKKQATEAVACLALVLSHRRQQIHLISAAGE